MNINNKINESNNKIDDKTADNSILEPVKNLQNIQQQQHAVPINISNVNSTTGSSSNGLTSPIPQNNSFIQQQLQQQQQQNLQSLLLQQYKRQQLASASANVSSTTNLPNASTIPHTQSQYLQLLQQQNFQQQFKVNQTTQQDVQMLGHNSVIRNKSNLIDNKIDPKFPVTSGVFSNQLNDMSLTLPEVSNKMKPISDQNLPQNNVNTNPSQILQASNPQIVQQHYNRQQLYIQNSNNPRYLQLLKQQNYQAQNFRANQLPNTMPMNSSSPDLTSLNQLPRTSNMNMSIPYDNNIKLNSQITIPPNIIQSMPVPVSMSTGGKRSGNSMISSNIKINNNRSGKSLSSRSLSIKDKDKNISESIRSSFDREESLTSLYSRREMTASKLAFLERSRLVGVKSVPLITIRKKLHSDYLMDEMAWMAVDFRQELRLKLTILQTVGSLIKNRNLPKITNFVTEKSDVIFDKKTISCRLSRLVESFWGNVMKSTHITVNTNKKVDKILNTVSTSSNLFPPLLDHQRIAVTRVQSLFDSGLGCVISGQRCVGKTSLIVAMSDTWLTPNNSSVLIFTSRRSITRWISEYERILPSRVLKLWLPDSSPPTLLNGKVDILLCILENLSDYIKCLSKFPSLNGVIIDFRFSTNVSINDKMIQEFSETITSLSIIKCLVTEDLNINKLTSWIYFLDNSYSINSSNPVDEGDGSDWDKLINSYAKESSMHKAQDITKYVVDVTVGPVVESFAAAQVREEIFSLDMDSLQHLKYYQVSDYLLGQLAFKGDNPWVLAQAVTLIRRVCFHEAFVSLKSSPYSKYFSRLDGDGNSHKNSYKTSSTGIGLGFGLVNGSLYTGTRNVSNDRKYDILPNSEGFGESISCSYKPTKESRNNISTNNSININSILKKYMQISAVDTNSDSSFNQSRNYFVSLAPGPLSSKLSSPARFNMNGNFYDSIGSCKLQSLCGLIGRFAGLRIVVMVSTIDEQLTVHNFLNRLGYDHMFAGIPGSKLNYNVTSNEAKIETSSWLQTQIVVQKFNRTPAAASALMVVTKDVFSSPGVIPWKADVVIILSDDWISPTDIRTCFRLRLTSAGPSGDPVNVVRVVSKQTIEESVARRGSLMNLQNILLSDIFHPISPAITVNNVMLSNVPTEDSSGSNGNEGFKNSSPECMNQSTWLKVLRLGLLHAEHQLSKICKFAPLSTIPDDFANHSDTATKKSSVQTFPFGVSIMSADQIKENICDYILHHSVNNDSKSMHSTLLRLIDCQIRGYLHSQDNVLDNKLLCYNELNNQSTNLLHLNISNDNLFNSMVQPIVFGANISVTGNLVNGESVREFGGQSTLGSGQGSPIYRAVQLFRNILSISKRSPAKYDNTLYALTSLQSSSKYDYVISRGLAVGNILSIQYTNKKDPEKQESIIIEEIVQSKDKKAKDSRLYTSTYRIDIPSVIKRFDEEENDFQIEVKKRKFKDETV